MTLKALSSPLSLSPPAGKKPVTIWKRRSSGTYAFFGASGLKFKYIIKIFIKAKINILKYILFKAKNVLFTDTAV